MSRQRYLLTVQATNTRVELRVNDIPVGMFAPGEAKAGAEVPINEFLLTGLNTLTAIVHANPVPSRVLQAWAPQDEPRVTPGQAASLKATLTLDRVGQPAPQFPAVGLAWSGVAAATPVLVEASFTPLEAQPVWAWARATALAAPDAWVQAQQGLAKLQALMERKDLAAVEALLVTKIDEMTRLAYGVPSGPLRAGFVRTLANCLSDPQWSMLPIGAADIDLRLVGNKRLVECLRPDGRHAVTFVRAGSSQTFFVPIMWGRLDGAWQILR